MPIARAAYRVVTQAEGRGPSTRPVPLWSGTFVRFQKFQAGTGTNYAMVDLAQIPRHKPPEPD